MADTLPDGTPAGDVPGDSPEPSAVSSALELTPREIAVAQGLDPDNLQPEPAPEAEPEVGEVSESETAEATPPAPVETAPAEPTTWITEQDRRHAERYGLDEYDLEGFTSRRDFLSALRFMDRRDARDARQPKEADKPAEAEAGDESPFDKDGLINVAYYKKQGYEPDQIAAIEAQRKTQERMAELEQQNALLYEQYMAAEQARYNTSFHDAVDKLGLDSLFGKSVVDGRGVEVPAAEFANRQKLADTVATLEQVAMQRGQQPALDQLVEQAKWIVFGDQIRALEAQAQTANRQAELQRIAKQSQQRRPVATGVSAARANANAPPVDPASSEAIARHPNVTALFKRFEEENGTAL